MALNNFCSAVMLGDIVTCGNVTLFANVWNALDNDNVVLYYMLRWYHFCYITYASIMIFLQLHLSLLHIKSIYDLWGVTTFMMSSSLLLFCLFAFIFILCNKNLEQFVEFKTTNHKCPF